jgi:predicted MFS family arabinose efflux permease
VLKRLDIPFDLVACLSLTQIIGWGTTYYVPAVLGPAVADELGIRADLLFLGVTVMIALGGLLSPHIGRWLDRGSAARIMPLGSLLIALGHAQFVMFPNLWTFFVAWALFGIASPMALSLSTLTLVTQVTGAAARRTIGILMLFTGMSASIFWPVASVLSHAYGWHGALAAFAMINLCVALPLNLWLARRYRSPELRRPSAVERVTTQPVGTEATHATALITEPAARREAVWLLVIAFSLQGFVSWGLPLHMISLFDQLGVASATAVAIAALNGPATIGARFVEVTFGNRLKPLTSTKAALALTIGSLVLLLLPLNPIAASVLFTIIWCGAAGVLGILRATLPLTLLGANDYGTLMGRISLPQHLAFASAPPILALAILMFGLQGGVILAIAMTAGALLAIARLARLAARPAAVN